MNASKTLQHLGNNVDVLRDASRTVKLLIKTKSSHHMLKE